MVGNINTIKSYPSAGDGALPRDLINKSESHIYMRHVWAKRVGIALYCTEHIPQRINFYITSYLRTTQSLSHGDHAGLNICTPHDIGI